MALKSSREGLRKELVDYLGNIIIDENLKQNIINSIDDVFIDNEELTTSVNELDGKIMNESSARESADTTLQENINVETSARESADSNLSDIKANKSDVLSLEEIQASTDLSGKIASASSIKYVEDLANLVISGVATVNENKEDIIANMKKISSIIEPTKPRIAIISASGVGIVIGYTYEKSLNPSYADYLYYYVGTSSLYTVNCYAHVWTVHRFIGELL